ncbi:MAG TPA: phosphotransferase [Candidatus Cryosericum sp.]|nr:phosphotransferase [Candidatus Cryosericum sp.]
MIDALSGTYRLLAAEAMGVPPSQVSVLMVHRPHEDKDYADQSVYFFFLDREEFPSAVGKVGFDPAGAHYLEREHRGLQSLTGIVTSVPRESVPQPLLYREVAGHHVLLQSALRGEKVGTWLNPGLRLNGRMGRFLGWAADWNAALGKATRIDGRDYAQALTEEFSAKIDRTGRSRALLDRATQEVRAGFDGAFPAVLAHGDFCGENILGENERYGVIDWEHCDQPSLPGYDILDLCLWIVCRIEDHLDPDPFAALERILNGRDPLAELLRRTLGRYAAGMGFRRELLPPLLTLAWVGYCLNKLRYLPQDESGHFARARAGVRKILNTHAEVLWGDRAAG